MKTTKISRVKNNNWIEFNIQVIHKSHTLHLTFERIKIIPSMFISPNEMIKIFSVFFRVILVSIHHLPKYLGLVTQISYLQTPIKSYLIF